jgi:hypothetical protein
LYPEANAPRHVLAMSVNSGFALMAIFGAFGMRLILQRSNRQMMSGERSVADIMKGESHAAIAGLTEEENNTRKGNFRYIT